MPQLHTKPAYDAAARLEWVPVLAVLLLLYVPTFYGLATWHWRQDEGSHGPIILALIVWLFWRGRSALVTMPIRTAAVPGFALLVPGLLLYVLGRSQEIALFEVSALVLILSGALLTMRGWPALRALWFPIVFVAFLIPLPGFLLDALTGPLKQSVSAIAEQILYSAGYPVARSGVVLYIGPYQLLVADACSGLHSMISLAALGLLFVHLTARTIWWHKAIVLVSILPIAFIANVIRVMILMLITYHYGDKAGQGFLHGAAGLLVVCAALIALLILDGILTRVATPREPA